MPLTFWKRGKKKPPEEPKAKAAEAPPQPPPKPEDLVADIHRRLVEAGLTIEGTREVFTRRVAEKFGSLEAFVRDVQADGPRAVTGFLAFWLGFEIERAAPLAGLLYHANQRLSGFKLKVDASEELHVNDAEKLREATLRMGDLAVTIQYRNPRDVFIEINEILVESGVRFLELETWTDKYAFMLVRSPVWEKLEGGDFVVVKALETANAGECGECASPVGTNWTRCMACEAPL